MFALVSCNQDSPEEVDVESSPKQSKVHNEEESEQVRFLETIEEFEVKDKTLPEAINKLNKLIVKKYPGKKDLLIAYVASFNTGSNFDNSGEDREPDRIDIHLINNPPIIEIVKQLTSSTATHFRIIGSQIIIYGWSRPNYLDDE